MLHIEIKDLTDPNNPRNIQSQMTLFKHEWKVQTFNSHFSTKMMEIVANTIREAEKGNKKLFAVITEEDKELIPSGLDELDQLHNNNKERKRYCDYFNSLIEKAYARHNS